MFAEIKQRIQEKANEYTSLLDKLSLKAAIRLFQSIQSLLWVIPGIIYFFAFTQLFMPLGTLNHQPMILLCFLLLTLNTVADVVVTWFLILITTRRDDKNQDERIELMDDELEYSCRQVAFNASGFVALPIILTLMPYIQFLRLHPSIQGWNSGNVDALIGSPLILRILFLSLIPISWLFIQSRFEKDISLYRQRIDDWMKNFEFHDKSLHEMLSGNNKAASQEEREPKSIDHEPRIVLGQSLETGDDVVLSTQDRLRNIAVSGPIGAGKSSRIFIPEVTQDIKHILAYIRLLPKASKDKTWGKEYGAATHFVSGLAVVETTDDLCRSIYNVAIALGVPKDMIYWFDPSNPKTPSMNLLRGPVESVAQNLTEMINGLKESNNDFFAEEERAYLMQHIYLLKMAGVIEKKPAGFGELMAMNNDIYVVVAKMKVLEGYVGALQLKVNEAQNDMDDDPDNENKVIEYDELNDKYTIAYETLQWFQSNVVTEDLKDGPKLQTAGPHTGEPIYIDKHEQFVGGLKNTLTDLSKDIGVRRVLFRNSGDFNIDNAMKNGTILLMNTAKDQVGATLARNLGLMYTLSIAAATYRRKANSEPLFPLYMDEFADYQFDKFTDLEAQARKYEVPICIGFQTPAQLSKRYGDDYIKAIYSVSLTRMTFGDMGADDAKFLEGQFGTHKVPSEEIRNPDIDVAGGVTQNRRMVNTTTKDEPNISANEIMKLPKYEMAVRHPGEHHSDVYDRITTHRVSIEEIKNDPDKFDLNNPRDKAAYEFLQKHKVNGNPDFDAVDAEIHQEVMDGRLIIKRNAKGILTIKEKGNDKSQAVTMNSFAHGSTKDKEENDDSDSKKILQGAKDFDHSKNKKQSHENDDKSDPDNNPEKDGAKSSPAKNSNASGAFTFVDEATDIDHNLVQGKGQKQVLEKIEEKESKVADNGNSSDAVSDTKKSIKESVSAAVENHSHNGNDRMHNNKTSEAKNMGEFKQKENWFDETPGLNITKISENAAKKPEKVTNVEKSKAVKVEPKSETLNPNEEDDSKMFEQNQDSKLVNNSPKSAPTPQERKQTIKDLDQNLKQTALKQLKSKYDSIISNAHFDDRSKLQQLIILREHEYRELLPMFPKDIDKIFKQFDQTVSSLKEEINSENVVFGKNDDMQSMDRKVSATNQSASSHLGDELEEMLKRMDAKDYDVNFDMSEKNSDLHLKNIDDDSSANGLDPFTHGQGMDYSNDDR